MSAISGMGTVFQRWSGSAWVVIGEVFGISWTGKSRGTIDTTHFTSPDGYREFIGALRDGGAVQVSMNFTRAGYELMNDDFESDALQNYEIVLPDADETSFEFEGLVNELPLEIPVDDRVTSQVTIKVSGPVGIDSGSGS